MLVTTPIFLVLLGLGHIEVSDKLFLGYLASVIGGGSLLATTGKLILKPLSQIR